MKKLLISILPIAIFLLVYSCKKGEVVQDVKSLGTGTYLKLVTQGNTIIDYANLNTSTISQTVTKYGDEIEKIKIYVTKGNVTLNKTLWKAIKEVPYSGDTKLDVKATEIATALGIPPTSLETGGTYTIYNQAIGKDGRVFDIANINGGFAGNPNYGMAFTWAAVVVCPFNATGFAGNFRVELDEWADFAVGDIVTVDAATATSMTMTVYPNPAVGGTNRKQIVVNINAATGAATVASQVYGDYPGFDTNLKVKHVGVSNWVFSCVGTVTLRLNHTGAANWGDYTLRLKKI
jgi:hypothetical protein